MINAASFRQKNRIGRLGGWAVFGAAIWMIKRSFEKEQRLKQAKKLVTALEKEKQELKLKLSLSQNDLYRAQVNPHLLFNVLNFIHSEIQDLSPKTSEAVIALSELMHYSLLETPKDGKIELKREVEQITHLINIHQCRFGHRLPIRFRTEGVFENKNIIPMLLLPLVENLLKYADLANAEEPAIIHIQLNGDALCCSTFNKKKKMTPISSTGIGLANVNARLQFHYPDAHSLHIRDSTESYHLALFITL